MKRAEKVKQKASEIVSESQKPSASRLARDLGMSEADVHRCLNFLENGNEVDTYTKEVLGRKYRMVGLKR